MPALCFRTSDIADHHGYCVTSGIRTNALIDFGWFWEFDFYDLDGNKFKVWEPKAK
jgi:hypothetical protein